MFSGSNSQNLLHISLGLQDKNFVKIPETMIAGDWSNLIGDLSPVLLLPKAFSSKHISFAESNINFFIWYFRDINVEVFIFYHFKRSPSNLDFYLYRRMLRDCH